MVSLLLPVGSRRMSTWGAHQRRSPRSSEPGTDFYCPIGTPVASPESGVVYAVFNSIGPATGRWVGVDFDNGMRFRAMHLSRTLVRAGQRVRRGERLGLSGASGYGEEDWSWNVAQTGGAHTHVTLWPTHQSRYGYDRNGRPFTVDFMNYVGGSAAGGSFIPEEDEMSAEAERKIDVIFDAIFTGGNSMKDGKKSISQSLAEIHEKVGPIYRTGGSVTSLRQELANINGKVSKLQTSQAGLEAALKALANAKGLDPDAILKAAQQGVENALRNVTFVADVDG